MQIPGVHITTLQSPVLYSTAQIERAAVIAGVLHRGQLVLVELVLVEPPHGSR